MLSLCICQVNTEAEAQKKAQAASEATAEATQKAREAARQLSEGRIKIERLERAQEALILERNQALDEVCCPPFSCQLAALHYAQEVGGIALHELLVLLQAACHGCYPEALQSSRLKL